MEAAPDDSPAVVHPAFARQEVLINRQALPLLVAVLATASAAIAQVPTEVQLPGTQPNEVPALDPVNVCTVCHANYDSAVEPWHNWQGSMMAQAARDPVFWAAVAVAEQDFPGAGDLCIRCHAPRGWAGGRSTPTNGSALTADDAEGVLCTLCHKLTDPDMSQHVGVQNPPFIANDGATQPTGYYGAGEYVLWPGLDMLGPYANTAAFHPYLKSNIHRDSNVCGTCHDLSNPVVGDLAHNHGAQVPLQPGTFSGVLGSPVSTKAAFNNPPYAYGAVERTYSEHQASAFVNMPVSNYTSLPAELQTGALETAYLAATTSTPTGDYVDGDTRTFSCQTCHVRPVQGYADGFGFGSLRLDLPLHDLTGGNDWAPDAIQYLDAQGKLVMGGGLSLNQKAALDAGVLRARENLEDAARLTVTGDDVRVVNLTGHKLITGYPEGRRMWLNVKWFGVGDNLIREDGAYGPLDVQIGGQTVAVDTIQDLSGTNTRIYHAELGVTQQWATQLLGHGTAANLPLTFDRVTGQVTLTLGQLAAQSPGTTAHTMHSILNNIMLHDNRIPPYGFDHDEAQKRNALPVPVSQYGNPGAGGTYEHWDTVTLSPPIGAHTATVRLLFQPISWEYVQFLALANNGQDAFLASTGQDLQDAWLNTGMATPHVMAEASWSDPNSPWTNHGHALAGTFGEPGLTATGTLQPGSTVTLSVSNGVPSGVAHLIVGFTKLFATPFLGGTLVPNPDVLLSPLPLDGGGAITLGAPWPTNIPSAFSVTFQGAVTDSGAPFGYSLTNAIEGITP